VSAARDEREDEHMDLLKRWITLAGAQSRDIGADLVARYNEPHRRYHTAEHLTVVLDHVDELAESAADADTVRLAAWFHDAVYDPQRGDNEELSAVKAERRLADTDLAPEAVAEVARLVRLTKTHAPAPDDRNGQVLCDADLSILAAEPTRYAWYASAVREEYAFVPDEYFRPARADILRSLLNLPAIFHTPPARERFEEPARHNLRSELMLLEVAAP
jgi:predicted metal-dependent HD superfamily phosphohydrolase